MSPSDHDEESSVEHRKRLGLAWTPRTYLRLFLVVAGVLFVVRGLRTGSDIDLLLGILAGAVGAGALYFERSG